jgi:hypothetical protein
MIRFRPSHILAVLTLVAVAAFAQGAGAQQAITTGGVLTGELHALRNRDATGKHVASFQLVSPPRRLPGPNGLCNLETGPETFQIVTTSEAEARQLKAHLGKQVSIRANEMTCAELAGQMSDAIVSKWSLVTSN